MVRRWFRVLVFVNVLTMILQAAFAGSRMSGNGSCFSLHQLTGKALVIIGGIQAATLILLRRRWPYPRWLLLSSIGIVASEVIEFYLGERGQVAIHVPLALAIFGGAIRQLVWTMQAG